MVFILDDSLPVYNGPISTSLDEEVATTFSQGTGLLWTIQPSYTNKFKFVIGIAVAWISCHKNEEEVLLMNQYLPIVNTINFDDDIENTVDHLLYSLKSYRREIRQTKAFYKIMGLQYSNRNINANIIQISVNDYVKLEDGRLGLVLYKIKYWIINY